MLTICCSEHRYLVRTYTFANVCSIREVKERTWCNSPTAQIRRFRCRYHHGKTFCKVQNSYISARYAGVTMRRWFSISDDGDNTSLDLWWPLNFATLQLCQNSSIIGRLTKPLSIVQIPSIIAHRDIQLRDSPVWHLQWFCVIGSTSSSW